MTRSSLFSLMLVGCLAMAGTARAQDTTRPSGDPDPMLQAATGDPATPGSSPTYDPNRPSADPNRPSTGPAADPYRSTTDPNGATDPTARTGDTNDPTRRNLPATASNAPVLLLIGAVALGTLAAFLVLRRRGVTHP
ncbi:MAG TPA: LPXTG cell wall anchor domain-containing protein [Candidatus Polarisedimenticolia bacterium]|jgi:LPXTG-motif cell wall-anchored protein|nr:LPXTG cell wall anchor domain-containing protein [Candidatus Polarisedimenticolia bacterium]